MNKIFTLIIFVFFPSIMFSQYAWDFGGGLGASNTLTDIGGSGKAHKYFITDMNINKTKFAATGFARYKLSSLLSFKANLDYNAISGNDNLADPGTGRYERNLSFKTNIIQAAVHGEIYLYENNNFGSTYNFTNAFRVYAFAGGGVFYYDPKTEYQGKTYKLRSLKTEGQIKPYSPISFSVPMGGGAYISLKRKYRVGIEVAYTKTFTDYLDDCSGFYADPATMSDPIAIALSNRINEVTDDPLFQANPGSKRGDPSKKDAFLTTSINYSYVIRGKSSFYKSKYGNIFGGKKKNKRRIRAKF